MRKIHTFLLNAALMTATALLMNTIGVWFSLYISKKIGMEAMGLFQLIMSVYSLGVTLATSGINLTATRLVAEEIGRHRPEGISSAMRKCFWYSLLFGCAAAFLLYINAGWIGMKWLSDVQTVRPVRVMAFGLPFLAVSSAMGGYFTAVRRVVKNASVQILEQLIRIVLTMMGLSLFSKNGIEQVCLTMIGASIVAEAFSFTGSYLLFRLDIRRYRSSAPPPTGMVKRMLSIGIPIALSSYLRSGLMTVKNLLVPVQLRKNGLSGGKSIALFGTIHGVVLPVVLFPSVFLSAFCSLIVPELTECQATHGCDIRTDKRIHTMVSRMFQAALLFSVGVGGFLFCFSSLVGTVTSSETDVAVYLRLFAPLIPIMYMDSAVDNMLKGLNEQVSSMRYNIIDAFTSAVLVYLLLPRYGIKGYLVIIFLSEILNAALSLNRLIRVTNVHFRMMGWVIKPLFCITASCILLKNFFGAGLLVPPGQSSMLRLITLVIAAVALYLILLCLTKCLGREDIQWIFGIFKRTRSDKT